MEAQIQWWREASLAADVAEYLQRVGTSMLDELGASALIVRLLDEHQLVTLAAIRKGVVGVTHPNQPASELTQPAAHRVVAWIESGRAEHVGRRSTVVVARDLLRGIDLEDGEWWLVPLVASSEPLGVMLVAANKQTDARALTFVSEPVAAVLAIERGRRELSQRREAAEADKTAALERLHMRDIGEAIVGADSGLRDVMKQVEQVAPTGAPVLIFGETGSGKEVVARSIHERSANSDGPILRVNCGAIPPELVDSELFGHERGSFTGASGQRSGWFERADGGTLFLDEIAELPLAAQVRLLRVVQDGVFERVGGARALKVDVRIVTATHRDLGKMVRAGQFREDLWYRINVFVIRLPPLRERLDDIAALADHFAARAARRFGVAALRVTPQDLELLKGYAWPGNVRELSAVIERAAILGEGKRLDVERSIGVRIDTTVPVASSGGEFPTLDQAMRQHIERALARCHGRIDGKTGAAALLGLHPNTLRSRMHKLGVQWSQFRAGAS
jgi:transcriptional regulator with GAF, ATPase, and Fis domain